MNAVKQELQRFFENSAKKFRVVVMPDYFLDRIVDLNCSPQEFSASLAAIAGRSGGSIDEIPQSNLRGGNAANVASALAALNVQVTPIVCTSRFGLELMRLQLASQQMDLSHVKLRSNASVTTALEFKAGNGKVNVMLRDLGSLADFGPADLDEGDLAVIQQADYVCVFNWAGTRKFGTELAETVFRHAKTCGNCRTYLDTADPTPNKSEIPLLFQRVIVSSNVDVLSVNENEALTFASYLDGESGRKQENLPKDRLALEAARVLSQHLHARVDLHTAVFSATLKDGGEVVVPAFHVQALRATGAGDAWDAGNILGYASGLSDECRLTLANAASACYLTDPDAVHPTRQKLKGFLESQELL